MIRTGKCQPLGFVLVALAVACIFLPAQAQQTAPPKLQAALIMKLLAFNTNLGANPFTIHVVGAPDVAAALETHVGKTAGKATLETVTKSDALPADKVNIVYVGNHVEDAIKYSQSNQILSVTGIPKFVNDGVTLGIGIENKKPKILLNLSSSKSEGINWNPAILKVAATIN